MVDRDPLGNIRVILCETSHPGNIGAAARAMKTMGLTQLHLVKPRRFPDQEATWRAARASDVLEKSKVHATLDQALHGVAFVVACSARSRDVCVPQVDVREAVARVIEVAHAQQTALVFGNETYGLTTAEVNKCSVLASIPANPRYASLNLAAAVQVFAYEARMAAIGGVRRTTKRELATQEKLEAFYAYLEEVMAEHGFMNRAHPKKLMPRLRRLFARAGLEPEEVNILRGILKALTRKN